MEKTSPPGAIHGFLYPFRGLRFILRNPRLLSYVALPAFINTLLYALFLWLTVDRMGGWIDRLVPSGEAWYWALLFYVLIVVTALLVLAVVVYSFTLVGSLILAPFLSLLSEQVERLYTGEVQEAPFELRGALREMGRSLRAEAGRIALYLLGFGLLLALNLFPPLGPALYGIGIILFTLYFIGWEYFDYSLERHRLPFGRKLKANMRHGLALMIPLLNLAAIPVCVAGATLLFCDLRREGKLPGTGDSCKKP